MLPIHTERLIIREVEASDAKFFAKLENDPIAKKYLGGPTGENEQYYKTGIEQAIARNRQDNLAKLADLVIESKDTKCPVGRCALRIPSGDEPAEAELEIVLAAEHHGQKLGPEVAQALAAHAKAIGLRLSAKIASGNIRSEKLAGCLGLIGTDDADSNTDQSGNKTTYRIFRPIELGDRRTT